MIGKNILTEAKAFLCWDRFPELSVQLIEMQDTVSYFYPPAESPTILVYYRKGMDDYSIPLFHLFHEAGHFVQLREYTRTGRESQFRDALQQPGGDQRIGLEKEGWERGRQLLAQFMEEKDLPPSLLREYDQYGQRAAASYHS